MLWNGGGHASTDISSISCRRSSRAEEADCATPHAPRSPAWEYDRPANNGPATTVVAGAPTNSGVAANADACYCPTGISGALTWGSAQTCGQPCPGTDAGLAGKFVVITASKPYTPLFADYGIVRDGLITASATVQVQ